jgi:hypothetical protein
MRTAVTAALTIRDDASVVPLFISTENHQQLTLRFGFAPPSAPPNIDVEGAQQVSLVLAFGGQPVVPCTSRGAPRVMRRTASIERRRSAIACASGMDSLSIAGEECSPTPEVSVFYG